MLATIVSTRHLKHVSEPCLEHKPILILMNSSNVEKNALYVTYKASKTPSISITCVESARPIRHHLQPPPTLMGASALNWAPNSHLLELFLHFTVGGNYQH